ncbi:MAG: hypothetical protein JWO72_2353 [Caulobacteraceae bacterium]|nr:hypothetical protein [Caulobacteraceae bacterium]
MPDYRLYYFDGMYRVRDAVDVTCSSDVEAISFAQNHADRGSTELWCEDRFVQNFNAGVEGTPG